MPERQSDLICTLAHYAIVIKEEKTQLDADSYQVGDAAGPCVTNLVPAYVEIDYSLFASHGHEEMLQNGVSDFVTLDFQSFNTAFFDNVSKFTVKLLRQVWIVTKVDMAY